MSHEGRTPEQPGPCFDPETPLLEGIYREIEIEKQRHYDPDPGYPEEGSAWSFMP